MDTSKFLSLLSQKTLWLARPDTFKDKKEGVFHREMKAELDKIYRSLNSGIKATDGINSSEEFQSYLSNNTYINCWHKNNSESMIMWEMYGQTENSVAIKTTVKKLKESFNLHRVMKFALEVALDDVLYAKHDSIPSEKNYRQPFFIKRPHFSFENEVRLYIRAKDKKSRSDAPLGYAIPVDLSVLIEKIYVHPDSEDWFLESIQDLAKKYNITAEVTKGLCGNKL